MDDNGSRQPPRGYECTEIDSLMSFLDGGCFSAILTPVSPDGGCLATIGWHGRMKAAGAFNGRPRELRTRHNMLPISVK